MRTHKRLKTDRIERYLQILDYIRYRYGWAHYDKSGNPTKTDRIEKLAAKKYLRTDRHATA